MKVDSAEIKSIAVLFGNKVPETTGQLESIANVFKEIIIDPEMEGKALKTAKEYYEQVYIPVIQNLSCVIEDANQDMIRYQLDFSEQVTSSVGEQIDTDQLETAENRIEQEIQRYIEAMDELKNTPLMDTQPLAISVTAADYRKNKLKAKREKVESFESAHSNHFSNIIAEIQHIQTMINSFKNGIPFNSDGSAYVLTSGQKASMSYLSKCSEKRKEKENESAQPDIGDRVWMEINESGYREWVLVEKGTSYATQADLIITKKYKEWALKYGKVEVMKEYSTTELDYHLAIINTGIDPNTGFPVEDWEKWRSWGVVLSSVSAVAISVYGTYKMYKGVVSTNNAVPDRSEVWKQDSKQRGINIESDLAKSDYKDWFNCGQLDNGKFPVVDFQKENNVVSLKSIDPTLPSYANGKATTQVKQYIKDLSVDIKVDGVAANKVLDVRVPEGTAGLLDREALRRFAEQDGIKLIIKEY